MPAVKMSWLNGPLVMLQEARAINDEESLREFMAEHGEKIIDQLGIEVDRIEDEITCNHPDIVHVDLEAQ
uniref:Uncharacterized protein n=1 Tax=Ascaris lumbricoides TaxID=6252 RepID=A0A9J2P6U0_ASCLU